MVAAFRLVITALQQLFERLGKPVCHAPQVRQQVGAGDNADTQFPVEGHDGDVEARVAKEGAEGKHRVHSATQKVQLGLGSGHIRQDQIVGGAMRYRNVRQDPRGRSNIVEPPN